MACCHQYLSSCLFDCKIETKEERLRKERKMKLIKINKTANGLLR